MILDDAEEQIFQAFDDRPDNVHDESGICLLVGYLLAHFVLQADQKNIKSSQKY